MAVKGYFARRALRQCETAIKSIVALHGAIVYVNRDSRLVRDVLAQNELPDDIMVAPAFEAEKDGEQRPDDRVSWVLAGINPAAMVKAWDDHQACMVARARAAPEIPAEMVEQLTADWQGFGDAVRQKFREQGFAM